MSETAKELESLIGRGYSHGFVTEIDSDTVAPGLDEEVVRLISHKKGEPAFLTEWRLKALRHWLTMKEPHWAHVRFAPIDYQAISYYSAPKAKKDGPKSLDEVDPKLLETYEKLGVPLHERARLAGVAEIRGPAVISDATATDGTRKWLLDVGAGPGTASWAVAQAFPALTSFALLDANPALRSLALDLLGDNPRFRGLNYDAARAAATNPSVLHGDPALASELWVDGTDATQTVADPTSLLRTVKDVSAHGAKVRAAYVPDAELGTRWFADKAAWVQDGQKFLPFGTPAGARRYLATHSGSVAVDYQQALGGSV